MKEEKTVNKGVGFVGLLQIAFIVLKLTGVIHWSWIWVLAPIWIDVILTVILVTVLVAIERKM